MPASAYLEPKLLGWIFGATAMPTAPATVYIALSTGTATQSVTEPSGFAYARVAVTNNTTNWPTPSGSQPATVQNANTITFPTATGSWGTIQSAAVYDAPSGGNLLVQLNLTANQTINNGNVFSFAANQFPCTCN